MMENIQQCKLNWGGSGSSDGKSSTSHAGTRVRIPVETLLGAPNACMRGEGIISYKSHIASVSLTDWCIMIFLKKKLKKRYIIKVINKSYGLSTHYILSLIMYMVKMELYYSHYNKIHTYIKTWCP